MVDRGPRGPRDTMNGGSPAWILSHERVHLIQGEVMRYRQLKCCVCNLPFKERAGYGKCRRLGKLISMCGIILPYCAKHCPAHLPTVKGTSRLGENKIDPKFDGN